MRPDLDTLLRSADPARSTTSDPAVRAALADLAADTRAVEPDRIAPRRHPARRWVVPATVALVAVGGTAAAFGDAIDLFSPSSPVHLSTWGELGDGGSGGCDFFYNAVPADGQPHTDESGVTIQAGSAETFDQDEYDAVVAFLETHDWDSELAGIDWDLTEYAVGDDGSLTGSGSIDSDPLEARVTEVLADHGLNTGGSATLVATAACGVSMGDSAPWGEQ